MILEMWIATCALAVELHSVSCEGIEPPQVKVQRFMDTDDGRYYFDGVVRIRPGLSGYNLKLTLIHEMTHYLYHQAGALPVPYTDEAACAVEVPAWEASNAYAAERGWLQTPNWREYYTACEGEQGE